MRGKWNFGKLEGISTDEFLTWAKIDELDHDRDTYLVMDKCVNFEKEICNELGKYMWRKHRSIFQDNLKYLCSDIVNPLRVGIIRYAENVQKMYNLAKHLPPVLMKDESFE